MSVSEREVDLFLDLRHREGLYTVFLARPACGYCHFRLSTADMARLIDCYLTALSAPVDKTCEVVSQTTTVNGKLTTSMGVPLILLIAEQAGISMGNHTAWRHMLTEIQARQATQPHTGIQQLNDLRYDNGIFTMGFRGPPGGIHHARLTNAGMAVLTHAYLTTLGSIAFILLTACRLGISIDDGTEWWNQQRAVAKTELTARLRQELHGLPGPRPG